jgi:hypothetical protein
MKVMLRPTVSLPVGQSILVSSPYVGPQTRFLLLSDSCVFVDVGRLLCGEDGSVVFIVRPRYIASGWTTQKTPLSSIVACMPSDAIFVYLVVA